MQFCGSKGQKPIIMSEQVNRTEISSLGEFKLIEQLTKNFELRNASSLKGIRDDAAVIDNTNKLFREENFETIKLSF